MIFNTSPKTEAKWLDFWKEFKVTTSEAVLRFLEKVLFPSVRERGDFGWYRFQSVYVCPKMGKISDINGIKWFVIISGAKIIFGSPLNTKT